jgi:hypothetical protein
VVLHELARRDGGPHHRRQGGLHARQVAVAAALHERQQVGHAPLLQQRQHHRPLQAIHPHQQHAGDGLGLWRRSLAAAGQRGEAEEQGDAGSGEHAGGHRTAVEPRVSGIRPRDASPGPAAGAAPGRPR